MRNTWTMDGKAQRGRAPAPMVSKGKTIPVPTGGWDAYSPIGSMPAENAVELINWFPQAGWVELRKGFATWSNTGTGTSVDSLMPYQGITNSLDRLFAASGTRIYDVTGAAAASGAAITNTKFQWCNFGTSGGHFLWICNGADIPRYWDGATWTNTAITVITPTDVIDVVPYRGRLWMTLKNSTKAAYLPLDSIQGAAATFELGSYFTLGGHLQSIATWSTSVSGGTDEYIVFISSFGECAIFLIYDPTQASGVNFTGLATLGSPIGQRCWCHAGADVMLMTLDGVVPLSKVVNYDRAAMANFAITKNIMTVMSDSAREFGNNFGWQIISYPRGNMAILNVPIVSGATQEQYVMNTITGAWCRFTGQKANVWAIFEDRAYFGGNDGIVRLADQQAGDEGATLEAHIHAAFNYYGTRGQNKRWTTIRPLMTKDATFAVDLLIGIDVDFQTSQSLDGSIISNGGTLAIWNDPGTVWDGAQWPGLITSADWLAISGIGYCAAIHVHTSIPWSTNLVAPQVLKINSFDVLYDVGAYI
jgi:hypothetical protein